MGVSIVSDYVQAERVSKYEPDVVVAARGIQLHADLVRTPDLRKNLEGLEPEPAAIDVRATPLICALVSGVV